MAKTNLMDILNKALIGQEGQENPLLPDPNAALEAPEELIVDQINNEAKSPNLMTKPELVQKQIEEIAPALQQRAVASEIPTPQKVDEPKKLDERQIMLEKLRSNITNMEDKVNKKDKEITIGDRLPDIFAALSNIVNHGKNNGLPKFRTDNTEQLVSGRAKKKETGLNELQKLQKSYQDYLTATKEKGISPLDKAKLEGQDKDRVLRAKALEIKKKEKPKASTEAEKVIDREFGKEYTKWNIGGRADYEVNSKIFKDAIDSVKSGKVETGPMSGLATTIPGVRTETKEMEATVRKAINGMLRATLGSQFTEAEGERIFKQTFDPFSSKEANLRNMNAELDKLKKRKLSIDSLSDYYNENKSLSGYTAPKETPEIPVESDAPHGEIVERNGKSYRWNSLKGKYQLNK